VCVPETEKLPLLPVITPAETGLPSPQSIDAVKSILVELKRRVPDVVIFLVNATQADAVDAHAGILHIYEAQRDLIFRFGGTYDRQADAIKWYQYLTKKYPDKPLLDNTPDSLPKNLNLEDYAIARVQDEVDSPGRDKVRAVLEGLETTAFIGLAVGEDDRFLGWLCHGRRRVRYQWRGHGEVEQRDRHLLGRHSGNNPCS